MSAEQALPLPPIYRLSQELIDEIIDAVHLMAEERWWADRWDYLSNCCLVCRSFLPRAQMHLFTHVNLPGMHQSKWVKDGDYSRVSALLRILENRPVIAQHIQKLSLCLPEGNTSWLYNTPQMLTLLQTVNATQFPLRQLVLSAEPAISPLKTSAYNTGFPHLYRFFKHAIAPYITVLHLEFVFRVPVELVTMCVHLRDLSLRYTTFVFQDPDVLGFIDHETGQPLNRPVDWTSRPKIEYLEYKVLEHDYEIKPDTTLSRLLMDRSFLDFSHLRCLTTFTDEPVRDLNLAQHVVDASQGSLVDVVLDIYNHECTSRLSLCYRTLTYYRYLMCIVKLDLVPSTTLNFAGQPNLQSLSYIAFFQSSGTVQSKVGGISDTCSMLKTIASPSSTNRGLRTLDLVLIVYPHAEETLLLDVDWETFVSEVTRIGSPTSPLGGKSKVDLTLYLHFQSSVETRADGERYEQVTKRLVDERLTSLKDCPWINLEWRLQDVIEHEE